MNEDKEKLSAWLDNAIELDEVDSLQAQHGTGVYSTAVRYNMIGDAIRGNVQESSMMDISARVSEAISHEPVLAPAAKPVAATQRSKRAVFDFGSWLRPVGGLAVAATVAMVMVVALTDQNGDSGGAIVANVGQQPVQSMPVNHTMPVYTIPGVAMPAVNLNSYVTQHSEYAAQDTMQGMMPYARAVSYGADKNPSIHQSAEDNTTVNQPGK